MAWEAAWEEQEVDREELTWAEVAWEEAAAWEEQEEAAWEEVAGLTIFPVYFETSNTFLTYTWLQTGQQHSSSFPHSSPHPHCPPSIELVYNQSPLHCFYVTNRRHMC